MQENSISLHDAEIIWYSFDMEKQILNLEAKIMFPENRWQRVKIHFDGLIGFDLQDLNHQNVIYDITKESAEAYFQTNKKSFEEKHNNFSLFTNIHSMNFDEIMNYLRENNIFAYSLSSSVGLNWVILAKNMEVFHM